MCHDRSPTEHASVRPEGEGTADHGVENRVNQRRLVTFDYLPLDHFDFSFLFYQLTDSKKKQMADAVEEIEREGGNRAVKDLFAGAVGGVAQVLIGE
jgi:hypothetical protein